MRWNSVLKSLLKTTVYILDQTAEQVDRVAAGDRTAEIRDHAKRVVDSAASAIRPQREDHTLRNIVGFAAGVGLGVGAGLLLAPARGVEIRGAISDRVKDISDAVKGRVATGTE